jgi:hypothetical protein
MVTLGGRILAEAVGEPGHGGEHAEKAEGANGAADFLAQGEEAQLAVTRMAESGLP